MSQKIRHLATIEVENLLTMFRVDIVSEAGSTSAYGATIEMAATDALRKFFANELDQPPATPIDADAAEQLIDPDESRIPTPPPGALDEDGEDEDEADVDEGVDDDDDDDDDENDDEDGEDEGADE